MSIAVDLQRSSEAHGDASTAHKVLDVGARRFLVSRRILLEPRRAGLEDRRQFEGPVRRGGDARSLGMKKPHVRVTWGRELVGAIGIEPTTPTVSRWCSTTELRACDWRPLYERASAGVKTESRWVGASSAKTRWFRRPDSLGGESRKAERR